MKFKFSYERLLEYNKQQEQVARRDYLETLGRLEIEKQKHMKMYEEFDNALNESFTLKAEPSGISTDKLKMLDDFMDGQKIRIGKQREIVINHSQIVEQKQEILIAAAKEFQILEKLKEKKSADFKKLQKKKEAKSNDELVVTRFRRGENS